MKHYLKFTFLLMMVFALAACQMLPTKDNAEPPATLKQFSPEIYVQPLWSMKIGDGAKKNYLRLNPAVVGNTIFVDDYNGDVFAVNTGTGKTIWTVKIKEDLTSGVAATKGKLFVATESGKVVALSQKNGKILWNTPVSSEILATPVLASNMVLIQSIDGTITALDQNNGQQIWRFQQDVPALILHAASQPTVVGNLAVVGFANGRLAAINIKTGNPTWMIPVAVAKGSTDIERMVDIDVNPMVVGNTIYVATYQGTVAAFTLGEGKLLWRHKISSYTGITADSKNIYISDAKSHVWAFQEDDGAVLWRQKNLNARMVTGPALLRRYVIVADKEGFMHWLNKSDGKFAARQSLDNSGAIATPIVDGDKVYVYTKNGKLFAFKYVGLMPSRETAQIK
jgi:outer membrane protein assembly factor BamB